MTTATIKRTKKEQEAWENEQLYQVYESDILAFAEDFLDHMGIPREPGHVLGWLGRLVPSDALRDFCVQQFAEQNGGISSVVACKEVFNQRSVVIRPFIFERIQETLHRFIWASLFVLLKL